MSKKKGMSMQEKADKLLEVFVDSADVFVLKDVEKLGAKKGIPLQTVKEVLQVLIGDDLVHQEKIGSSNYFWAFPGEASVKLQTEAKRFGEELQQTQKQKLDLSNRVQTEKQQKQDTQQRVQLQKEMKQLEQLLSLKQQELAKYSDCDPETVQACRDASIVAKDAANRWIDNIYNLKTWCNKQFPGTESEVSKFFEEQGVNENLDYIE